MSQGMQEIVRRMQTNQTFLGALLANPGEATMGFDLTDQERAALGGNSAERLGSLMSASGPDDGCGSAETCPKTCGSTCTYTFTKVEEAVSA